MKWAGYCRECGAHVWLTPERGCPHGHPAASIIDPYQADLADVAIPSRGEPVSAHGAVNHQVTLPSGLVLTVALFQAFSVLAVTAGLLGIGPIAAGGGAMLGATGAYLGRQRLRHVAAGGVAWMVLAIAGTTVLLLMRRPENWDSIVRAAKIVNLSAYAGPLAVAVVDVVGLAGIGRSLTVRHRSRHGLR